MFQENFSRTIYIILFLRQIQWVSMISLEIFLENSISFCVRFFLDFSLNCFRMFRLNMLHLEFLVLRAPLNTGDLV
jgi:hypothetical protein